MPEYSKYDLNTYTLPLWEGDTVYNETLMFVDEKSAPLLYKPDRVISVRSFDLATEYVEGEDYTVEDGCIVLTENTKIPCFTAEEYYPAEGVAGKSFASLVEGHPYIFFSEGSTIFRRQIHVTYTHSDKWTGFLPKKSEKFGRFIEKASRGDEVTVLFFGDSITTGSNSSGRVGCEPYADTWMEMIVNKMREYFKNDKIKYVNTAVGGKATPWAIEVLDERAIDVNPDLMFLAFGMNDGGRAPEEEGRLMNELLDRFCTACPECDVALVSPMLPHFRLRGFWGNQPKFEGVFSDICAAHEHMDLIPVTSVHTATLERKRYYDMTGNNVNHPNDFLARIYAQTALKVFFG